MTEQEIAPMFPTDEDLLTWVRNQLWVIKNGTSLSNDMIALPAGRVCFALQRLCYLLNEVVIPREIKVEYETGRGPAVKDTPKLKSVKVSKPTKEAYKNVLLKNTPQRNVGLKPKEKKVFEIIQNEISNGNSPTYRGIAEELGLKSHAGIHTTVKNLEELGVIKIIGKGRASRIALTN